MTLALDTINKQVADVKALYLLQAELKAEIEKIETSLKEQLKENNKELVVTENGTITYKEIYSKCLDMKAFRASEFAFVYDKFATVEKVTRRFKVA